MRVFFGISARCASTPRICSSELFPHSEVHTVAACVNTFVRYGIRYVVITPRWSVFGRTQFYGNTSECTSTKNLRFQARYQMWKP